MGRADSQRPAPPQRIHSTRCTQAGRCISNVMSEEVAFEDYLEGEQEFVDGEGISPDIQAVYDKTGPVCRREHGLPN
jgi:hypothetical protein